MHPCGVSMPIPEIRSSQAMFVSERAIGAIAQAGSALFTILEGEGSERMLAGYA